MDINVKLAELLERKKALRSEAQAIKSSIQDSINEHDSLIQIRTDMLIDAEIDSDLSADDIIEIKERLAILERNIRTGEELLDIKNSAMSKLDAKIIDLLRKLKKQKISIELNELWEQSESALKVYEEAKSVLQSLEQKYKAVGGLDYQSCQESNDHIFYGTGPMMHYHFNFQQPDSVLRQWQKGIKFDVDRLAQSRSVVSNSKLEDYLPEGYKNLMPAKRT